MEETVVFQVFGIAFGLNTLLAVFATVILILILCAWTAQNLSVDAPSKPQLMMESLIDFVRGVVGGAIDDHGAQNFQLLGLTLLLFIFMSNMIGLPLLLHVGHFSLWRSPTADPIVCLSLALLMILLSHFLGVNNLGFKSYVKNSYLQPSTFLFPIKIVEEFTNALTLALRLYGNIFAGEVLLGLIAGLANLKGPLTWVIGLPLQMIWQGFSIFIGAIQAYIFVTLTMVYLSHKVETEHE
ncbi:F0F1 ATP synthase subunit A [Tuanshanicoccus lijuaniae]|uniref:F0F1 ATP synthase subunit A n=1 Tax=Aerococcaceae bacterium zg-1292 TaxID=2774330 RepID=UPI00385F8A0C|nr:F0F1 ATP synthase subunit A [Aerococcaceae bacterium zg-BR22]